MGAKTNTMKNLSSFLEKFKSFLLSDKNQKNAISNVIFNIVGVILDHKNIDIKNNKIYIKTSPIIKNQIFMSKTKILSELKTINPTVFLDIQ